MNYNVKRLTRPLKGICTCNYEAVKSISELVNNNIDYRQYNKAFFIRQLGEVMERINHGEGCELIEPVVPGQELAEAYINGREGNKEQQISLNIDQDLIDQGMLIITTERGSNADNAVTGVTLVYPSKYVNNDLPSRTLQPKEYNDILTTVPLTKAVLNAMYERMIELYRG